MPSRSTADPARPQCPASGHERPEQCRVLLVTVRSGVAECRARARGKTQHTERWAVFETHEQFGSCAEDDPLRFADPLQFRRIKGDAESAFAHRH
jgi:hypothetical protein